MSPSAVDGIDPDFEGRILVVANRLPISIKPTNEGEFEYSISSGGLASGLRGLSKVVDLNGLAGLVLTFIATTRTKCGDACSMNSMLCQSSCQKTLLRSITMVFQVSNFPHQHMANLCERMR